MVLVPRLLVSTAWSSIVMSLPIPLILMNSIHAFLNDISVTFLRCIYRCFREAFWRRFDFFTIKSFFLRVRSFCVPRLFLYCHPPRKVAGFVVHLEGDTIRFCGYEESGTGICIWCWNRAAFIVVREWLRFILGRVRTWNWLC
jgi:hypothetical protein